MADKCIAFMKKQRIDGQQSNVTSDLITQVKTAINVDDKNAYNSKSLLNCIETTENESVDTLHVKKAIAHKLFNDTNDSSMQAEGKNTY